MNKVSRYALIVMLVMVVVIAGCSSKTPPKKALETAALKTMEADSYKLSMTMEIDELDLPVSGETQMFSAASIAGILKDATIKVDAIYSKKELRTDMNVEIVLPGMMDMKLAVPMIMKDKLLYVKMPNIPLVQLPDSIVGKFIVIDPEKMAADQGKDSTINIADQQKFIQELSIAAMKHFDEKNYFSDIKVADAELPEGVKADQVVKFTINETNYAETVELLVNKVLPELLDILLANEEGQKLLQVEKAELEKLKADWDTNKTKLLNVLQNDVKINLLELTGAINDNYLVYQTGKVSVEAVNKESGLNNKIGLSFSGHYTELDKKVTFEQEIPSDALTFEQVQQLLTAPAGL